MILQRHCENTENCAQDSMNFHLRFRNDVVSFLPGSFLCSFDILSFFLLQLLFQFRQYFDSRDLFIFTTYETTQLGPEPIDHLPTSQILRIPLYPL